MDRRLPLVNPTMLGSESAKAATTDFIKLGGGSVRGKEMYRTAVSGIGQTVAPHLTALPSRSCGTPTSERSDIQRGLIGRPKHLLKYSGTFCPAVLRGPCLP